LKEKSKCSIVPPTWLQESELQSVYDEEVRHADRFSPRLPWHWMEVSAILLRVARDDLESPGHVIRGLLRDIREVRQAKARQGLQQLNDAHMRMDGLGALEINEIRPFVGGVMDQLRELVATVPVREEEIEEDEDEF